MSARSEAGSSPAARSARRQQAPDRRRAPRAPVRVVKTQWLNDGIFIGAPLEKDPLVGPNDGTGSFTVPERPIRRRLQDLPPFVVTRGGEYCFVPGLRAMRWLAELEP
jgi:hypothetical protein